MECFFKAVLLCFYFLPAITSAASLNIVNVEKKGERYILHIEAHVNANANRVKEIVTNYGELTTINPYLKESKILSIENNRTTVSMLTDACVLVVCYKIKHVQVFRSQSNGVIFGRIIPNLSDFKQGWTRWTIKEGKSNTDEAVTQLMLETEMTPDFFILPIIGTHHVKKKILEIATATINKLEKEAQKK